MIDGYHNHHPYGADNSAHMELATNSKSTIELMPNEDNHANDRSHHDVQAGEVNHRGTI